MRALPVQGVTVTGVVSVITASVLERASQSTGLPRDQAARVSSIRVIVASGNMTRQGYLVAACNIYII